MCVLYVLWLRCNPGCCVHFQVMRIIDNVRPDRQCVLFSATFPRQMEALARRILLRPVEVQVGGKSIVCKDVEQHVVGPDPALLGAPYAYGIGAV